MTRVGYDSINASAIPSNAQVVAGYVDGRFAWTAADWALFPNAAKVRIAVFASTNDGAVLDVETGDATPQQAPGWCQMRRAAGQIPTIYCNESTWPAVVSAFTSAGVPLPLWWEALYDDVAQLPANAIAKQYTDNPPSNPYDTSVVADYWPGVDSGPIQGGEEVYWIKNPAGNDCYLFNGTTKLGLASFADLIALQKAGIAELPVPSQEFFDSIPNVSSLVAIPGATGPQGPPGPPGVVPKTAAVTGTVTLS